MKQLIKIFLTKASRYMGFKFIYIKPSEFNTLGKTAVKSADGFWYVGNVFDPSDIAYGISANGVVEAEETSLVKKILNHLSKNGPLNFYDIGANTGYYGILSAFNYPKSITYSFEPLPEHVACIEQSAKINNIREEVRTFMYALGDKKEEMTFYVSGSGSTLQPEFNDHQSKETRTVQVERLDDMVKERQLNLPDFIKIDVEGHEYFALQGGLSTIRASLPVLFIEIAETRNTGGKQFINEKFQDTFLMLNEIGYTAYQLKGNNLTKANTSKKQEGVYMYLFLQTEKHADIIKSILKEDLN